ncbi:MAG: M15 family metallopeptidase [Bacilli bacterium]|nr:M15 family metallopeptidase [Bacilli bacterium]
MKKKRLKKSAYVLISIVVISIVGSVSYYLYNSYVTSDKYLLLEKGYTIDEVSFALTNKEIVNTLLKKDYNKNILVFMKEKYYLSKNLDKYLEYKKQNPEVDNDKIVSIINVGADSDWYVNDIKTDLNKGILMIVNKHHYLDEDYNPDDLVTMPLSVAFKGKKIINEVNEAFIKLCKDAKSENLTIVANSTYRDFNYQSSLYKRYKNNKGQIYADNYAARPGYSEHQTGLSIDVSTLKSNMDDFEKTKEYKWLIKNAYKYGFILRYPKGKEDITGYNYESWHYRYVGIEAAKIIYEENITFDEYYAYYVE